ncbi:MAG: aldo/keto reductase [Promethearchaeota archaeon]|nr:MAG: aldo/keto reductase [Candidatus Lokiarchaeota archaeon]
MKYRKLFGDQVSVLGFGCMRLPTIGEGKDTKINESEAIAQIRHAIDLGIRYVDTAYPYHNGKSEIVVGKALKDGYREKIKVLTTKAPVWLYKKPEDFEIYLKEQLGKLQVDYVDAYLMHALNGKRFKILQKYDILAQAKKAKEAGLIKNIGFSFHSNYETFVKIIDSFDWDLCQIQMNYMDVNNQATEKGLKYAGEKGIPVIIMEPLLGGKLVRETEENKKILEESKSKHSLAEWAFLFMWNYPEVKVTLSGMNTMQMIEENCKSTDLSGVNSLSDEDMETIGKLRESFGKMFYIKCTRCEYCMPCPQGVNIPFNFVLFNELKWAPEDKEKIRTWYNNFSQTMEEAVKTLDGAAHLCVECGQCLEKCPQGIEIPDKLKELSNVYTS